MGIFQLSKPFLNNIEVKAISKAVKSGWISTSGEGVKNFEKRLKKKVNSKYAVVLNSGTSAVHMSLIGVGVKKDDEVLVPSLTFVATINPILYLGARPVFFDSDNRFNLKINDVINFIKYETIFKNGVSINKKTNKRISAIIIVHLWGNCFSFKELIKFCKIRNIKIIEDSTEGIGAKIKEKKKYLNCGTIGDIGCYSFNGNKIISTGSGGAIVTNNKKIYEKIKYLSNQAKDDTFRYIHNDIGYNYKLNNICSVLGIEQLKKLDEIIRRKRSIHLIYKKEFTKFNGINLLEPDKDTKSNYWLNVITFKRIDKKFLDNLKKFLDKEKIEIRQVWRPNHIQKKFEIFQRFKIKDSKKIYDNSICLPSSAELTNKNIIEIAGKVKKFYENIIFRK